MVKSYFLQLTLIAKSRAVGTALLHALEEKRKRERHFIFIRMTLAPYQFYEHRGFERAEEKEIVLEMPKGKVPVKMFYLQQNHILILEISYAHRSSQAREPTSFLCRRIVRHVISKRIGIVVRSIFSAPPIVSEDRVCVDH